MPLMCSFSSIFFQTSVTTVKVEVSFAFTFNLSRLPPPFSPLNCFSKEIGLFPSSTPPPSSVRENPPPPSAPADIELADGQHHLLSVEVSKGFLFILALSSDLLLHMPKPGARLFFPFGNPDWAVEFSFLPFSCGVPLPPPPVLPRRSLDDASSGAYFPAPPFLGFFFFPSYLVGAALILSPLHAGA